MSDTPRTDHQEMSPRLDIEGTVVYSDFARQLERELAKAREQRDTLAEAMTELLDALGATHKPHELIGYGIAKHRAQEIVALAAVKGGEA